MAWAVEFTDEFEGWWNGLSEDEQVDVDAKVRLLEELGPALGRPHADTVQGSRHANMKELRIQHAGRPYRGSSHLTHVAAPFFSWAATRQATQAGTTRTFPTPTRCTTITSEP